MATKKKMLMSAAGQAGGDPLDIDDVFSTYLYTGNSSTQTITNGIDLDGEGGLVWTKSRSNSYSHGLYDTERGVTKELKSDAYTVESTDNGVTAFNSNGYNVGNRFTTNQNAKTYVSWTFRKAPKFFDIVTYTGNGVAGRTISHNLGCDVGAMFIKRTNVDDNWPCYHRSLGGGKVIQLNVADQAYNVSAYWNSTNPTDSVFTLGSDNATNNSGDTYVAYLFAHNNGNGNFGPDGDQDIIKCGNFTTQSSAFEVDLGFEPQWIMLKLRSAGSWYMYDVMRGIAYGDGNQSTLYANQSYSEFQIGSNDFINPTPTGFSINQNMINQAFGGNQFVTYIAIRRGPLAVPEDATKVFGLNAYTGNTTSGRIIDVGFPVDLGIIKNRTPGGDTDNLSDRLRGPNKFLTACFRHAENTSTNNVKGMNNMVGFEVGNDTQVNHTGSGYGPYIMWGWKRAPGYFDITSWKIDGTGNQTINHNLGVIPEMIWHKNINDGGNGSGNWWVAHKDLTGWSGTNENDRHVLKLSETEASGQQGYHRDFTDTSIRLISNGVGGYTTSHRGIAYLFASAPGVSKVGSYTGNGTSQTIDCGFSSGARFVLIKRTDSTGGWFVFDTERGIVAGNDPRLKLNSTSAESSADDCIDPNNSGFIVNQTSFANVNVSSGSYIFYAIA